MSSPRDNGGGQSPYDRSNQSDDNEANSDLQDLLIRLFGGNPSGNNGTGSNGNSAGITLTGITRQQLATLMNVTSARTGHRVTIVPDYEDEGVDVDMDDDDDDPDYIDDQEWSQNGWPTPHTEPQKAGLDLLASGEFGRVDVKNQARRDLPSRNMARTVLNQFARPVPVSNREAIQTNLVPNSNGVTVASYEANMYTAQFSDDASFYYTCAQDFKLHVFDMRAPPTDEQYTLRNSRARRIMTPGLTTQMQLRKVIQGNPGSWTITDANLSPDNERLIYSSITPTVYMTSIAADGNTAQTPIHFGDPVSRTSPFFGLHNSFGIWSCRFSADGNEIVAGGRTHIFVYDLLANRRTVKISAHHDDINSCCWADTTSGNVLVSASDDATLKVWDRRSLGSSRKPSGVLLGHTEGLTYVSAKGDGRYIISNGKDQACRLWDLRKMRTNAEYEAQQREYYGVENFDYRYPPYPRPNYDAHPKDCSVMTYRGHSVLRTLIRCHFSPGETTGAQYIYSGSADGRVHIWSLDGTIVQVLDRSKTLPSSFASDGPEPEPTGGAHRDICVRDVSWSSKEPVIMSAGWHPGRGGTVIARHSFKGLSKRPGQLEDWAEKRRLERLEAEASPRQHRYHIPGRYESGSDDDDDF